MNAASGPRPLPCSASCADSAVKKRAQKTGITVIATTYDASIDRTTANDNALNSDFATPNRNITGENTMMVVIVDASTASATSLAPSRAASGGALPSAR